MSKAKTRSLELSGLGKYHGKAHAMNPDQPFATRVLHVNTVHLINHSGDRATIKIVTKDVQADFSAWLVEG